MKRKPSKRNKWEDHYSRQAKREKYPARSVYKLREIQKRERLVKRGHRVLDLGCSPGSWLLYASELVGKEGRVVGIDIKPVRLNPTPNIEVLTADVFSIDGDFFGPDHPGFDVVLSDMAPSTTGIGRVDAARSHNLCEAALAVADAVLVPGGGFVCKIFQGEDFKSFTDAVRQRFVKQKNFKPQSCRKGSREIYVIGLGKRQEV